METSSDIVGALATFLGGVGLFLLAIRLISNGLKVAAGDTLRKMLARSTRTTARGIATGAGLTALVQSSSAVTVAIIGFVNAGLMSLPGALSVVYGANIGTTVTSWLVALSGFKIDLQAFALPLIGMGMFARVLARDSARFGRWGAAGEALAGFGLFFIGVSVLQEGFAGAAERFDLGAMESGGISGTLLFVTVGAAMTVLTQSSSAAIAITLTAATGGALSLDAAAATVIGASVGTTSTAAFAVIGATPNARRVAAGHVLFNLVTAVVAVVLLPLMLSMVRQAGGLLQLGAGPAIVVALFHTLFKLMGVALFWPFTDRVAALLERRFRTHSEALGRPQHLDANIASTPALALDALRLELQRVHQLALQLTRSATLGDLGDTAAGTSQQEALHSLLEACRRFIEQLSRSGLPQASADLMPHVLRLLNYLEEAEELITQLRRQTPQLAVLQTSPAGQRFGRQLAETLQLAEAASDARRSPPQDTGSLDAALASLGTHWGQFKDAQLNEAVRDARSITMASREIDALRNAYQATQQLTKAARKLHYLGASQTLPVSAMEQRKAD